MSYDVQEIQLKPKYGGKVKWFDIDWRQATYQVKQLQMSIAVAYKQGNMEKVQNLQHKLVNSQSRKRLAVKIVTTNKGKKTPGVDGVIWDTPQLKRRAIQELEPTNPNYKAKPVKRVYIPKGDGKLRP